MNADQRVVHRTIMEAAVKLATGLEQLEDMLTDVEQKASIRRSRGDLQNIVTSVRVYLGETIPRKEIA